MSDKIFTDEVKKQLEGVLPCAVDSTKSITPDCFKGIPSEYTPIFKIKGLTKADVVEMENITRSYLEQKKSDYDAYYNFVFDHIVSWSNLYDLETGIEIKYGADARKYFDCFPAKTILSIYTEYQIMAGITEREKEVLTS